MWSRTVGQPGILFGMGQPPDVRATVPSVWFRTVEIDIKHQRKILASLFQGGMVTSASFWLRCWCRKDEAFCERLFTLYRQHSEKDKQHVELVSQKKFLWTSMLVLHLLFPTCIQR